MTRATRQPATHELTFEEYLALPESMTRQEVIDGVIIMSPTPTFWHQALIMRLGRGLDDHVTPRGLGKVFVAPADVLIRKLPKLGTRQPDVMFFTAASLAGLDLKRINVMEVAPALVVEIVSPSERPGYWAKKLADYAAIGIREVWRVDPEAESIEVLVLHGDRFERHGLFAGDELARSVVWPDLALPVAPIFD